MWEDPIVKEVRQHRLAIEAEAGNDWKIILARAVETQRKFASSQISALAGSASVSIVDNPDKINEDDPINIVTSQAEFNASGN